jgi:thymidylate synthase ThyX
MQPIVSLLSYTEDALDILIYTKDTRLHSVRTLDHVHEMSEEDKLEQLEYMLKTIQTPFEFVDYIFRISRISRATTHQMVRTRTASFQQESMRAADVRDHSWSGPKDHAYNEAILFSIEEYANFIDNGMPIQDARGVLPTAIHTSILMKANLRTLSQMANHRLCVRTQGEYQMVFREMRHLILEVHPWAEPLLRPQCGQTGVCAFPNYKKCPIQPFTVTPEKEQMDRINRKWQSTFHEANPVAKDGRTM